MNLFELNQRERGYITNRYKEDHPDLGRIYKWLNKRGFKEIGNGFYSHVLAHSKRDYVVKLSKISDIHYLRYATWAQDNWQHNPLLPPIHDIWRTGGMFLVVMDKLIPNDDSHIDSLIDHAIKSVRDGRQDWTPLQRLTDWINDRAFELNYPEHAEWARRNFDHLLEFTTFIAEQGMPLDLHKGNIMRNPQTRQFVITDPVG